MGKIRVDADSLGDLKRLADDYWDKEIADVRESFDAVLPPKSDRTYAVKKMEKKRLIQAQLALLRELAKHRAGFVHEAGNNMQDEKHEYERVNNLLKQARKMISEEDS